MPLNGEYEPSPSERVRRQVELYEATNGVQGGTLNGKPVIVLTSKGAKSGKIRKIPLIYIASKHAVEGLTKAGALEAAAVGVRVNAVAPGPVETEMLNRFTGSTERKAGLIAGVPLKRSGTPEEIAQTIVFLVSDKASFVTGHIIAVDGGKLAS